MRLIALTVVRNEDWILGASLRAALKWVDGMAILLDRCTDRSTDIIREVARSTGQDIVVSEAENGEHWDEMYNRQQNLEDGRKLGGTHFAIVDADEILTHNLLPVARKWFEDLGDGQVLDLPMVAPWKSLDYHSPHTTGIITLGFKDMPEMGWAPRGDEKYHHHNRPPHGMTSRTMPFIESGGVFHLQWAALDRKVWKERHYMMSELIRWNYPESEINEKYHWWNRPPHGTSLAACPSEWWGDYPKNLIKLNHPVWYERECRKLIRQHGASKFAGLNLFGWKPWE